jgi:hypothetical protein
MPEWLSQIARLLSGQNLQNAVDAVGGGLLAALFFGRKTPIKLLVSGLVAGLMGYWFGAGVCELIIGACSMDAYRAFSSGIGVISWPMMLLVPELPHLVKKWASKE